MRAVISRHPDVEAHLPGDPLLVAIIPRAEVDARYHYVIEDEDLVAMGRSAIIYDRVERGSDLRLDAGSDVVLVVGPAQ